MRPTKVIADATGTLNGAMLSMVWAMGFEMACGEVDARLPSASADMAETRCFAKLS